jgi:hypothetical protein
VIEKLYSQEIGYLRRFSCHSDVLLRWVWVLAWMVVSQDDGRGTHPNRLSKTVRQPDDDGIGPTLVDEGGADKAVLDIEQQHSQLLLSKVRHLGTEVGSYIGWLTNHQALAWLGLACNLVALHERG